MRHLDVGARPCEGSAYEDYERSRTSIPSFTIMLPGINFLYRSGVRWCPARSESWRYASITWNQPVFALRQVMSQFKPPQSLVPDVLPHSTETGLIAKIFPG